MKFKQIRFVTIIIIVLNILTKPSLCDDETVSNKYFPKDFLFGVASASYQIEGGWDADGKGESIWDYDARNNPSWYNHGENGDIACDSYHKTDEDVGLLKDMGVGAYRFSISWPRILPTGKIDNINQKGIEYYKDLITKLRQNNIEPMVTMFHWDTPRALEEEYEGFLSENIISDFVDYATLLFETFGDQVKIWTTFNEPRNICEGGYGAGGNSPNKQNPGIGGYACAHNVLKAHAKVYHVYNETYKPTQQGKIGMVIDTDWYEPASNSTEDIDSTERVLHFHYGWFADPIVNGDYPQVMKDRVRMRSTLEGFNQSRLPEFTEEEKQMLKGTYDYLAVNTYSTEMVKAKEETPIGSPSYESDQSVNHYQPSEWEGAIGVPTAGWFKVVPWGLRHMVKWMKDTYGDEKGIFVTENGYIDNGTVLEDLNTRGRYHKLYLSNLNDAIYEDNVNMAGYMAWSLLNDVEWYNGWSTSNLGMYHVDFNSPNRTRTAKQSAMYYKQVCTTKCLIDQCVES